MLFKLSPRKDFKDNRAPIRTWNLLRIFASIFKWEFKLNSNKLYIRMPKTPLIKFNDHP